MSLDVGEFVTKELSVWVVVDLDTTQGRQMVLDAIKHIVRNVCECVAITLNFLSLLVEV